MENNVHILELAKYEKPEIVESNNKDWIEYGAKNDYYDWLIGRYKNSTTNNAVINNIAKLIYGRGLHALDASRKPNEYAMMKAMISPKALRGIALNFKMLGAGYFQILYNKQHTKIVKVDYIPTRLIRVGKCNKDGEIDTYYYSDNWDEVRKNPPVKYSAFGTSKDAIEIDCVKFDSIDMKYYTDVDWHGGIPYAVLEESIADFQINDVQNGFSATKLINFSNGVPTEEAQRDITRQVKNKLTGSSGDKIIVSFNDNAESKATIEDISLDDAPEHYQYLSNECQAKILNSHTVISPMIVGITNENHGFSSNADEIEMATKVFYNQSIVTFQQAILDKIDEYLAFNGAALDLYFKRLNLMDSIEEKQQAKEEAELRLSDQFIDLIHELGENDSDDWVLMDEREVDLDEEENLNNQVKEWEAELQKEEETTLSKIWKFATGRTAPNKPSEQDREVRGFYFKVRYVYAGNPAPQRKFCREMMRAAKLYRKEDIDRLSAANPNKGFGEGGTDNYDLFKYKGGARCRHKWKRRTYVSANKKATIGSPKTNEISTGKGQRFGYRVDNPSEVSMMPKDMPLKGFSPNNPNLPSDV
tara:strand:- start:1648 stop:3411 length:1764 start_codon:yes stop_codon:yes gene_type:complete